MTPRSIAVAALYTQHSDRLRIYVSLPDARYRLNAEKFSSRVPSLAILSSILS